MKNNVSVLQLKCAARGDAQIIPCFAVV